LSGGSGTLEGDGGLAAASRGARDSAREGARDATARVATIWTKGRRRMIDVSTIDGAIGRASCGGVSIQSGGMIRARSSRHAFRSGGITTSTTCFFRRSAAMSLESAIAFVAAFAISAFGYP
jgi:hypothetical protein